MPVIPLEQGTSAWHEFRAMHIMGTDVSCILGSNPWKSKLQLWEEKLGFRQPQPLNDAMRRGQELEPLARKLAFELINVNFEPMVIESSKHPWLAVSLDGISELGNHILEIKCPKEATHLEAIQSCYPSYYYDQIQTQLLVTRAEICYYFSYRPEYKEKPYAIIEVYPDPEKHEQIIKTGYDFYRDMCLMNPPKEWKLEKKNK
jgi:putative phage-type endonuclease